MDEDVGMPTTFAGGATHRAEIPAFAGMTGSRRAGMTTLAQPRQSEVRFQMDILPIACTLTRAELERDTHSLMPGLLKRAPALTPIVNGVRLEFDSADDVLHDIVGVIERERQCCRFLQFALTVPPSGKPFSLEITGPEGTTEFLAEVTTAGTR